jgi:hypothetical protein
MLHEVNIQTEGTMTKKINKQSSKKENTESNTNKKVRNWLIRQIIRETYEAMEHEEEAMQYKAELNKYNEKGYLPEETMTDSLPFMERKLRQTGRTTRMLDEAKKLAKDGRAVYVVADSKQQAYYIRKMAGEDGEKLGIKFESIGGLSNFDWDTMRTRGSHPNCVFLLDHFVIEARFSPIIEALHRYD